MRIGRFSFNKVAWLLEYRYPPWTTLVFRNNFQIRFFKLYSVWVLQLHCNRAAIFCIEKKLYLAQWAKSVVFNSIQYVSRILQYRLWSFKSRDTKLERFLPKNQHTQIKLLDFENWCNGKVSKSAKIWLSKSIFYIKNHWNLSQFFKLKNTNFVFDIFW